MIHHLFATKAVISGL